MLTWLLAYLLTYLLTYLSRLLLWDVDVGAVAAAARRCFGGRLPERFLPRLQFGPKRFLPRTQTNLLRNYLQGFAPYVNLGTRS